MHDLPQLRRLQVRLIARANSGLSIGADRAAMSRYNSLPMSTGHDASAPMVIAISFPLH
jgi:hypothetical protein